MELGKKIRQLRFKAGLTQDQLAEKLGISPQSVSKWENAAAMPDITTLPLLAEIPMDPSLAGASDRGGIEEIDPDFLRGALDRVEAL